MSMSQLRILCGYPLQNNVQLVNKLDCLATHEEADITCSSCSSTGNGGRLSGRTSRWRSWTARCLAYAQQWASCETKCGQLPGMHALSGCDTVSYPYGKGEKSALKVLVNNDIDDLQDVLGEPDISQGQLSRPLRSKEDRFPEYR